MLVGCLRLSQTEGRTASVRQQTQVQVKVLVPGNHSMVSLLGTRDELLKLIEAAFESSVFVRGNEITITGEQADADRVARLFEELIVLLERGDALTADTVGRSIDMVRGDLAARPSVVFGDAVLTARGRSVKPKTVGQKKYVDAIRNNTVVFGIGPAGTGKTYLAMAVAVQALTAKETNRLILTRPAVEAGEKLGFLPGTLSEKIDPYLRPLYDALYEMMDAEQITRLIERGTIEVAPLGYMRGRAQPYDRQVLTPWGFRPIGSLAVGDLVTGSDGLATPVLGVYPQGRKETFRVQTQDGASTLCCGEHLWTVTRREDRHRVRPHRVVETREMIGQLRRAHYHRFELPLVSRPVEFEPQPVPMDPYALGLLLGDGCLTTSTTPSFTTGDAELADALELALDGIELRRKGKVDYVLRHTAGHRGGVIVANPVTAVLRELGLAGTRSGTKFVPEVYLHNSAKVRLAVLQGLLDTDGGPVTQRGRTCRVQYGTCSPRLRDDVVFLVRSLGGVAYWRTRVAAGRAPGHARGRDVHHRSDSFVLDIRLPAAIEPFRLTRKRQRYQASGGGRPMRFVHSIEPAGEAETLCIQVAAADSLYVTDDFLVTHNTLNDSFIVLDEAQNTTPEQMKMFLTRLGFNSKAVVTGDITQIDLPTGQHSGLNVVREILTGIDDLSFVYLSSRDVVRHKIVQDIVEAYRRYDEARS
jgi:phosphate starvation-inducible protein PhoH and related proteins